VDPLVAKNNLQSIATRIGFDDCRVAPAGRARHADEFLAWVARGKAGDMKWLERNPERRTDPRQILPVPGQSSAWPSTTTPAHRSPTPLTASPAIPGMTITTM